MSGKVWGWFFLFFLFFSGAVFAQEVEITQLNNRVMELERKFAARENAENIEAVLDGLQISCGITFVVQGTRNANGDDLSINGEDVTDAAYSVDLAFEKKIGDNGKAFIHLESGDGSGVQDELKVYSGVNRDASDSDTSVCLTEAWYEHCFEAVPLCLSFGKMDASACLDTNAYANDECTQFLGQIFGNSPVIEFPDDNACGVSCRIQSAEWLDISAQVMDADADWEDVFDAVFASGEFNIKPGFWEKSGNYRLYTWLNNKEHTEWLDPGKRKEKAFGLGISIDQEIAEYLGMFCRWGWQSADLFMNGEDFSLEQAWTLGAQLEGNLWGRPADVLAFGVGRVMSSHKYKEANLLTAKAEKHFEIYYNFKANEYLSLSPDLQVIWEPYGSDAVNGDKTIFVAGLRTQIDF